MKLKTSSKLININYHEFCVKILFFEVVSGLCFRQILALAFTLHQIFVGTLNEQFAGRGKKYYCNCPCLLCFL